MNRRVFVTIGVVLFLAAAAIRLNNALQFPFLRSYDGFAHFGYIWFLAETGRVPLPDAGWEFFQPPVYYALMVAFWKALPNVDALFRLRIGIALVALLGLIPAFVSFRIARRYFHGTRLVHLLAPGLMLFLPVHLYSAGFLGNEGFAAVLCSLGLLALVWTLRDETFPRAALLGVVLGVCMLVKFTALVVVATAFATLGLRALVRRDFRGGAKSLSVVAAVMFAVCGWFYVRNVVLYGNPFQMSRDQLFLKQIETAQIQGRRTLLEYILFDPVILYRPQWPRGLSLDGPKPPGYIYSAMRESVPTGLYANTWFDGYGGFVLPRVTQSETVRRSGQVLLTLGMIPTLLMVVGILTGIGRLVRQGWDDILVAMLFASAAMAVVVIQYTLAVPTQSAVKATYLMPVSVAFSFWFALGFERLTNARPRFLLPLGGLCGILALVSSVVFTQGLFIDNGWMTRDGGGPAFRNLHGVIYAAAGDIERAREMFELAARDHWPLAEENLADLALRRGDLAEALYRLRAATRSQEAAMVFSTTGDRRRYVQETLAEYANSRAVVLHELGWAADALAAARQARMLNPLLPEAHYNFGVLSLRATIGRKEGGRRTALLERARRAFEISSNIDPAFREAAAMQGVAMTLAGDCDGGTAMIHEALVPHPGEFRSYPLETGPGDQNAAGLHRRRRIEHVPAALDPHARLTACGKPSA